MPDGRHPTESTKGDPGGRGAYELRTLGRIDLRRAGGEAVPAVLRQNKRLALLAFLATEGGGAFQRRDTLLGLFWPELDQSHARNALSQALYTLRRRLGDDVIVSRGNDEVGIAAGAVRCDAVRFRAALEAGEDEEALALYRGEYLPGLYVPDALGFERWLDRSRRELAREATAAAWRLAERERAAGAPDEAVRWGRRAVELAPFDEVGLRRLLGLLDRAGDQAGALRIYETFARRLERDLDTAPSAETRELAEGLRGQVGGAAAHPPPGRAAGSEEGARTGAGASGAAPSDGASPGAGAGDARPGAREPSPPPADARDGGENGGGAGLRGRVPRFAGAALLAFVAAGALALAAGPFGAESDETPVLAVGDIRSYEPDASAALGRSLPHMLATSLARLPDLRVVSATRLYEIVADLEAAGRPASLSRAAREAAVDEVVEGELYRGEDGLLRLDLRRVELETGSIRDAYRIRGGDAFALVDRATAALARDFGQHVPTTGIADVATASLVAYRFYEEGLRAYYDGDDRTARRVLGAALAEDSAFAMAAYYRAKASEEHDHLAFRRDLGRAIRHADRATERERLLIHTAWAQEMDEPRQLALAESLTVRFPSEPAGHLFLGRARMWSGDFRGALPHLRRVIRMDSLSLRRDVPPCRACDALRDIVVAHLLADSLATAEEEARGWVERRPESARAWHALAWTLEYQGRTAEALIARRRAAALRPGTDPRDPLYAAILALRDGDVERVDRLLDAESRPNRTLVQQNVLWFRTLSLLYQGRYDEALAEARRYRRMVLEAETAAQRRPWESVLEGVVLREMGRPEEAAALWRSMSEYPYEAESAARTARHRAWTLAHAADALAAAGDTASLAALVDTIRTLGARSAYGRDPRLHHFARGMLLAVRGDTAGAVGALRSAVFSLTAGYAPVNRELGRMLVALDRPGEASRVLRGALRGPLDRGNLYASRTDLHALLARAYRAAGRPDSARRHQEWVDDVWRGEGSPLTVR